MAKLIEQGNVDELTVYGILVDPVHPFPLFPFRLVPPPLPK